MPIDPTDAQNETARQAFGYEPAPPPPPPTASPPSTPRSGGPFTPSGQQLSGWWRRAGAYALDGLLLFAVGVAVALAATLIGGDTSERTIEIVAYAIGIPLGLAYAPVLMARTGTHNGQTFGKQALGIRVVRMTGEPVSFWNGVLRTVVAQQLLTMFTLYIWALFDYLWPLGDKRNEALHDKIAKTWVVRTDPTAASAPAWPETAQATVSYAPPSTSTPPPPPPINEAPTQGWLPPSAGS